MRNLIIQIQIINCLKNKKINKKIKTQNNSNSLNLVIISNLMKIK